MTQMTDEDRALIDRVVKPYTALHALVVNYPEEVAALLSAARDEGRAEGSAEVAWLIEWPGETGGPTRWWHPVRGWQINACDAIRFARKIDAEDLRSRYRLQGKVTEHVFVPAPPASQAASQREAGWLVEHYASKRGEYLAEWLTGWPAFDDSAPETWTKDSAQALRFARREDAEQVIQALGWTEARATEHVWGAPPASLIKEG